MEEFINYTGFIAHRREVISAFSVNCDALKLGECTSVMLVLAPEVLYCALK